MPVPCFEGLRVHETAWVPDSVKVPLQLELDACFVPADAGGSLRVDVSNIVVIDGLIDDQLRQALLKLLSDTELADAPPLHLWEQRTVDDAANPEPTWGLKDSQLLTLKDTWAVTELHSRLQLVYPSIQFFHMPADAMQAKSSDAEPPHQRQVHGVCEQFVANAAVAGNQFQWHVDADPANIPPDSDWASTMGLYANREAGKPRFVSLLAYLNSSWGLNDHAETLFLDSATDTGAFVRPKPGRVILLDQDVLHRASAPVLAARRPRYSLVWKLLACAATSPASPAPAACFRGPVSPAAADPAAAGPSSDAAGGGACEGPAECGEQVGGTVAVGTCVCCGDGGGPQQAPGTLGQGAAADACAGAGVAAAPRLARWRTVSILLPEHGTVTAFGSARKMRDLQESVAGGAAASAPQAKRPRG